jgi:hypothetical protein
MNEEVVVERKRNSPPRGAGGAKTTRRFIPAPIMDNYLNSCIRSLRVIRVFGQYGVT